MLANCQQLPRLQQTTKVSKSPTLAKTTHFDNTDRKVTIAEIHNSLFEQAGRNSLHRSRRWCVFSCHRPVRDFRTSTAIRLPIIEQSRDLNGISTMTHSAYLCSYLPEARRLRHVQVESADEGLALVPTARKSRQCDDERRRWRLVRRQLTRNFGLELANLLRGLEPVADRHTKVHEDNIRGFGWVAGDEVSEGGDGLGAILGGMNGGVGTFLHERLQQAQVDLIVCVERRMLV